MLSALISYRVVGYQSSSSSRGLSVYLSTNGGREKRTEEEEEKDNEKKEGKDDVEELEEKEEGEEKKREKVELRR